jgi:hypothetical protein
MFAGVAGRDGGGLCFGAISFIEARALEDYPGGEEDAANVIATFGTNGQRLIGHFLPRLEAVATGSTKILVRWHIPITSYVDLNVLYTVSIFSGYAMEKPFIRYSLLSLPVVR